MQSTWKYPTLLSIGGNQNDSYFENAWCCPKKLNLHLLYGQATPHLGIYSPEMEIYLYKDLHQNVHNSFLGNVPQ